ncbi:MAG: endolytic transglycosylase MltG [Clostridiales Family XIII bacterium]|jgi:UPF0755 protein|nr:endolytic transglycosylase MltG [Clostridiales Family XIII bacterium]
MKKFLVALIVIVVLAAAAGGVFYYLYTASDKPVGNMPSGEVVYVEIPEGSGTAAIAGILKEATVIDSEFFFKLRSKSLGFDGQYKAGEYELSGAQTMTDIMKALIEGVSADTVRFTIPEGYNTIQVKNVLVEAGLVTEDEFLNEVRSGAFDYDFLVDCPAGKDERFEGFLYPETYDVYADASAHDIIVKLLDQFDKLWTAEDQAQAAKLDMSVRDIVTMASIVERESKAAEERPLMAGVFYNRLEQGMKLESCATIQYILGEPKEFLTIADTQIESPYNTYLHEGLPPGPVCNPRIQSIEAALYPDDNDYIFFVVSQKLDGTHNFSADYNKFLADKDAYQTAVANR